MSRVAEWQIVTVAFAFLAFLTKHRGHRFADDVAAAQNHHFRAVGFHLRTREQFMNARRCAGPKTRCIAQHQFADVDRMKTIHVLFAATRSNKLSASEICFGSGA